MANQITCITKPDPHNSHEAINACRWRLGQNWRLAFYITPPGIVLGISSIGRTPIFVRAFGQKSDRPSKPINGTSVWYIKTRGGSHSRRTTF